MGSGTDGISYKTDRDGSPNVFNLNGNDDGLWLNMATIGRTGQQSGTQTSSSCSFPQLSSFLLVFMMGSFVY